MASKKAAAASAPTARPHMLGRTMDAGMVIGDGLVNLVSGMGTDKDKLAHTMFGYAEMPQQQLDAAYRSDWISRKAIDIPAQDATREWRQWEFDGDDLTKIEDAETTLRLQRKVKQAMIKARLYGGAALVMGVDGSGTNDQPLDLALLKEGCLKFVHCVSRYELTAAEINNDLSSPWFGEPTYYQRNVGAVSTAAGGVQGAVRFHPSRVIQFIGLESPDPIYAQGWGDSVLQVVADAILSAGTVMNSIAQLVAETKTDIVKIPGLSTKIANETYKKNLQSRFAMANTMKSVFNTLLIDSAEDWERLTVTFTGMPEVLNIFLQAACGAVDIPATRFLSQSPAGMNATGDSDVRNYYDRLSTSQETEVRPTLQRLDDVMLISTFGKKPEGAWYDWRPLWQMTETEKGALAVQKATVMTADVNAALMNPAVLQKARQDQLINDGTYPGLEQTIEELGDDPEDAMNATREAEALAAKNAAAALAANNSNDPANAANTNEAVPPANNENVPPKKAKKVVGDKRTMADRIAGRLAVSDASTPRTLYISRVVQNQADIKKWAKSQGFKTSLDDMHVTVMYTKTPIDWLTVGANDWGSNREDGGLDIKPGGPRVMEYFGDGAIVLAFSNSDLQYRNRSILRQVRGVEGDEVSVKFDDYTPHITITYDPGDVAVQKIKPYQGAIVLGPEIFAEALEGGFDPTGAKES